METFYISTQPGFEDELKKEILEIWPYLLDRDARVNSVPPVFVKKEVGGWEIEAPLILGLQINFFSKVASRVLLRLKQVKVRDFAKLEDILKKIPLSLYFSENFQVSVAASKSRLNNEKRILETAYRVFNNFLQNFNKPLDKSQNDRGNGTLMIRFHEDICAISVDTSGEHLHFRSKELLENKWVGEAPLRETIAAFMIRRMMSGYSPSSLSGVTLWDPMAGSGTIISEALQGGGGNFSRSYNFQLFTMTPKLLKSSKLLCNYPSHLVFAPLFSSYIASDKDQKMTLIMERQLSFVYKKFPHKSSLKIFSWDVFGEQNNHELVSNPFWILTNPPYGKRLALKVGFDSLVQALIKTGAERVGILLPRGAFFRLPKGWRLREKIAFKNGGIPVEFILCENEKVQAPEFLP